MSQQVKNLPAMQETQEIRVWSLGWEDSLEKEMVNQFSIFAWKIPQRSLVGYSPWGHKRGELNLAGKHKAMMIFTFFKKITFLIDQVYSFIFKNLFVP